MWSRAPCADAPRVAVAPLGTVDYLFTPALLIILLFATVLSVILVLLLLPHAKGLCLGMMWALGLKGGEQH